MARVVFIVLICLLCDARMIMKHWMKEGTTNSSSVLDNAVHCGESSILNCFMGDNNLQYQYVLTRPTSTLKSMDGIWYIYKTCSTFTIGSETTPQSQVTTDYTAYDMTRPTTEIADGEQLDSVNHTSLERPFATETKIQNKAGTNHDQKGPTPTGSDVAKVYENVNLTSFENQITKKYKISTSLQDGVHRKTPTDIGKDHKQRTNLFVKQVHSDDSNQRKLSPNANKDETSDFDDSKTHESYKAKAIQEKSDGNRKRLDHRITKFTSTHQTKLYAVYLKNFRPKISIYNRKQRAFVSLSNSIPRRDSFHALYTLDQKHSVVYRGSDNGFHKFRLGTTTYEELIQFKKRSRVLSIAFDPTLRQVLYTKPAAIEMRLKGFAYTLNCIKVDTYVYEEHTLKSFSYPFFIQGFDTGEHMFYYGYSSRPYIKSFNYTSPANKVDHTFTANDLYENSSMVAFSESTKSVVYCDSYKKYIFNFQFHTGVISPLFESPFKDGSCPRMTVNRGNIYVITTSKLEVFSFKGQRLEDINLPGNVISVRLLFQ